MALNVLFLALIFLAGTHALLSCRMLLGLRLEENLPFLNFVVRQSEQR